MNAQYLGILENGENVTTLSTILKVYEVLGAVAGEMIREEAAARRMPKDTGTQSRGWEQIDRGSSIKRRSKLSNAPEMVNLVHSDGT
jgi:hypothetical protein